MVMKTSRVLNDALMYTCLSAHPQESEPQLASSIHQHRNPIGAQTTEKKELAVKKHWLLT